jgi:hypothetical protein
MNPLVFLTEAISVPKKEEAGLPCVQILVMGAGTMARPRRQRVLAGKV